MKNKPETISEVQEFAAAFSKASAKDGGKPRLSLNEVLHCTAVARGFKNWATMKSSLSGQDFDSTLQAIPEFNAKLVYSKGAEARNFTSASDLPESKLFALASATREAASCGMDVVVVTWHSETLGYVPVDLQLPSAPFEIEDYWRPDAPITLGYSLDNRRQHNRKSDGIGNFLHKLGVAQKSRIDSGVKRQVALLILDAVESQTRLRGENLESFKLELLRLASEGRKIGLSVGYFCSKMGVGALEDTSSLVNVLRKNSHTVFGL